MTTPPPSPLLRLLESTLPRGVVGDSMIGDLVEEWHRRGPGVWRTLWFAWSALGLTARYGVASATRRSAGLLGVPGDLGRRFRKHPVQTGLTVLALGIGIAAPSTMLSIVDGLTGEITLEEPDRVVHIGRRFTPKVIGIAHREWLWPTINQLEAFDAVGLYRRDQVDLSGLEGYAERLDAARVTPGTFEAFGEAPAVGRALGPGDVESGGMPVVLGHELWRTRFAADPSILGATIRLDGAPHRVVGVMPEGFAYPGGVDLWMPLDPVEDAGRGIADYQGVGRLAEGATLGIVRDRLAARNETLRRTGTPIRPGGGLAAELWRDSLVAPEDRRMLSVLVLLVGFVLAVACADVLNLLLARALARSRETAVRIALGAGRLRIVSEHLAEAAVLSAAAGLVGVGLTVATVRVFEAQTVGRLGYWMEAPRVDLGVVLFAAGMVALAALGTGLVPALQSSRVDAGPALREGGRGASAFRIGRFTGGLVVAEIAFACALLAVAALMVRGAVASTGTSVDYATHEVLTARFELRPDAYSADEVRAFHRRLVEELEVHPGIASAAVSSHLPGVFSARRAFEVEGNEVERPEDRPRTNVVSVAPSFLTTLQSAVVHGRPLAWADRAADPEAVLVNEAFVREHLAGRDPLGARLRLSGGTEGVAPWSTVVGVVPDLGVDPGLTLRGAGVYLPITREPTRSTALLARAGAGTDPLSLVADVRERVASLDPDLALWDVDTLAQRQIGAIRAVQSVLAVLFLAFGLAGLLLAGVGLYGLLSFNVRRRTRELGVRSALGAKPGRLLVTAVGGGLLQLALGLTVGLGFAALVAPHLGPVLLGAEPRAPLAYVLVATALGLTGIAATAMPAGRALRVDVVEALRTE